jgi:NAD(P)-dependent dehydrogenase (short-subunit alcohol dehydrogenase family)
MSAQANSVNPGSGRLAGKKTLITGAAGGIGGAAARRFAAEGALVGLLDRPGPGLDAIAAELGAAGLALPTDLTDEASVAAASRTYAERTGGLDVLYCCAAIQPHDEDGPADRVSLATWQRVIAVNLTGVFLSVKHAIGLLRESAGASIILCGSPTGLTMSGGGCDAYAAAKGGVHALGRALAADYAADGIRVNILVPGTTRTPLIEPLLADPERRAELLAGTPLGRLGTAEDTTGLAVYLASDESAFATAATFVVDGGLTRR